VKRRAFIAGLGSVVAWPVVARAQQPAMPVIGLLSVHPPEVEGPNWAVFRDGLRQGGFVAGVNVAIEYRYASSHFQQMPSLAADLVSRRVAIIGTGPESAEFAKAATATIPIVFVNGDDPVRSGLVASLNRPGGNLTGVTLLGPDLLSKRLNLLHRLVPQAARIGVLVDSISGESSFQLREVEEVARQVGVSIRVVTVGSGRNLDGAFATLAGEHVGAVFITAGTYFFAARDRLIALAAQESFPAFYFSREHVVAGGLATYGPSVPEAFRQAGAYAARILKGEKPADLPVQLPTKYEMVINLKTAKALGLTIPETLLATADEVIQ
jgi:putative tryptophan/tyrosine transport system substrate-binding protein